jgi:hypothetical protein
VKGFFWGQGGCVQGEGAFWGGVGRADEFYLLLGAEGFGEGSEKNGVDWNHCDWVNFVIVNVEKTN